MESEAATTTPTRGRRGLALLVFVLCFAAFLPALGAGFVNLDDGPNFVANPNYRGLGAENLRWMFTTFHMGHYQPVSWMTLAADYLVWGMDPRGYHLTNVVVHCATAVVFYFLCLALLARALSQDEDRLHWGAFAAALFFAVHPLRVESVAWVTERRDVVSGFFYVASLLAYVRIAAADGQPRLGYAASFALFTLSLLSKAWAITMPLVLLLLDAWPLRRRESWGTLLVEKIPFFAVAALFAAVAASAQVETEATRTLQHFGAAERFMQACYGLCFYVWRTVVPVGLQPLVMLEEKMDVLAPVYLLCAGTVAAVSATLFLLRRRCPAALTAWLVYAITVSPVLGFVQSGSQKVADRYSYLACLPFALLFGAALSVGIRRFGKTPVVTAFALVVALLGGLTWRQTGFWSDSISLWSHAVEVDPRGGVLWSNLAGAYEEAGRVGEALPAYARSLELSPRDPRTRLNFGLAYAKAGRFDDAAAEWRTLLEYSPEFCEAHFSIGVAAVRKSDFEVAADSFREAVECEPDYVEAYSALVQVLKRLGRSADAEEAARRRSLITNPYRRPWS